MNFTGRDLALVLPDEAGDAASLRFTADSSELTEKRETLKPRVDASKKVLRYRPGKAPEWAGAVSDPAQGEIQRQQEEADDGDLEEMKLRRRRAPTGTGGGLSVRLGGKRAASEGASGARGDRDYASDSDEDRVRRARSRKRAMAEAEIVKQGDGSDDDHEVGQVVINGEDEDEGEARRARVRARMRAAQREQEEEEEGSEDEAFSRRKREPIPAAVILKKGKDDASEEEGDSSEWETATESEEEGEAMLKPVFVPKSKRITVEEQSAAAAKEEAAEMARVLAEQERKAETRDLVASEIRRETEETERHLEDNDSEADMMSDTDDPDDLLELEAWRVRELRRLKRDRDEREAILKEIAETERRRKLTDEERRKEDEDFGIHKPKAKKDWSFMQKYYHKGAFYMDEDSIKDPNDVRLRDNVSAATGDDQYNKAALPKAMQVRGAAFGKMGQTKWTHLSAEDTTDKSARVPKNIQDKMLSKMAGTGDIDAAFRRKKKK